MVQKEAEKLAIIQAVPLLSFTTNNAEAPCARPAASGKKKQSHTYFKVQLVFLFSVTFIKIRGIW